MNIYSFYLNKELENKLYKEREIEINHERHQTLKHISDYGSEEPKYSNLTGTFFSSMKSLTNLINGLGPTK